MDEHFVPTQELIELLDELHEAEYCKFNAPLGEGQCEHQAADDAEYCYTHLMGVEAL